MYGLHWVCPRSRWYVLSQPTLFRLQVALQGYCPKRILHFVHFPGLRCWGSGSQALCKGTDSVGHAFYALIRSEQIRRPGARRAHCSRWAVHLNHLPGPGCPVSRLCRKCIISGVPCVSSGSWSHTVTLLADVNRFGTQEDLVSNWEPARSLVEDASLWGQEIPLSSSSGCWHACLSASGVREVPVCSQLALLWCWHNPLFCEQTRLFIRLVFCGKVLSLLLLLLFFFLSLSIP